MDHVSSVIESSFPDVLRKGNTVKFLISELCDNIEQHAESTNNTVMAQYYPNKKFVDIGLVDNGVTIPGRFEKSEQPFDEDARAIYLALNGVSTKKEEGRGHGLPFLSKLLSSGLKAQFCILSREGAYIYKHTTTEEKLYIFDKFSFNGTAIYMRFGVPKKSINIYRYIS